MAPAIRSVFLRGDPHRLARVTIALLDLAVRAAGPGDDIELRMDFVTHPSSPDEPESASVLKNLEPQSFAPQTGEKVCLRVMVKTQPPSRNITEALKLKKTTCARAAALALERSAVLSNCESLVRQMGGSVKHPWKLDVNSFFVIVEVADPAGAASDQRATGAFAHPHMEELVSTEPKDMEVQKSTSAEFARGRPDNNMYAVRKVTNTGLSANLAPPSSASSSGSHRMPQSAHVLAVDDSPYNIDVAKNMLQMLQHRVTSAENGRVAVDRLLELREVNERAVDLILMDCDMPVMDGWGATAEIRRIEEARGWARVPIIAITAYASSDSQARCFDAGMDDYLAKPYSLATLRQKVAIHLKENGASVFAPGDWPDRPPSLPTVTSWPDVGASALGSENLGGDGLSLADSDLTSTSSAYRRLDAGVGITGLLSPVGGVPALSRMPSLGSRKPTEELETPRISNRKYAEEAALRVAARTNSAKPRRLHGSQGVVRSDSVESLLLLTSVQVPASYSSQSVIQASYSNQLMDSNIAVQSIYGARGDAETARVEVEEEVLDPLLADAIEHAYRQLAPKAVVNTELMVGIFGGNAELISQAVGMFISSSKDIPHQIKSSLTTHNYGKLHRAVHQCKGSAGYIGAERVATISLTLQQSARELQQQQAASAEPGSVVAPLYVRAQVHALTSCMKELFDELEKVTTQ
mmetsp:Transcript_19446/g.49435  ORF Transcript_19446/g.49435 Transcript_19446/m.49435 type:complete len:696 (-) Transcript_19446:77-2164(-)